MGGVRVLGLASLFTLAFACDGPSDAPRGSTDAALDASASDASDDGGGSAEPGRDAGREQRPDPDAGPAQEDAGDAQAPEPPWDPGPQAWEVFGTVQIDSLSPIMNLALAQDEARLVGRGEETRVTLAAHGAAVDSRDEIPPAGTDRHAGLDALPGRHDLRRGR